MIGQQTRTPADILEDHGRLLIRRAVDRDDEISQAIFDIAAGDQTVWTLGEWAALLTDLQSCDMTISEWVTFYG